MEINRDKLSPMMKLYMQTKEEYSDCILFYRLGDFFELFFDDAKLVSKELSLTLTGRDCGLEERAPMCGVPYHAVDSYLNQLVSKGYKVAICDQVEDPATAKGIVKREVIRIATPGTNLDVKKPVSDVCLLQEKPVRRVLCRCDDGGFLCDESGQRRRFCR